MNPGRRSALIAALADELRANDSWTGETHVQKATYFLQDLLGVPADFEYVLYKYGPFSFELREHLTAMRALGMLRLVRQPAPYGPTLETTPAASQLHVRFPKTIRKYRPQIEFVGEELGGLGVGSLERLATALYVTTELGADATVEDRARELNKLKPHVPLEAAAHAVERLDAMRALAEQRGVVRHAA